jgi:hypothetical protein
MHAIETSETGQAMRLFDRMPEGLDLRDEASLEGLLATADALLDRSDSIESLSALEYLLAASPDDWPLASQMAVKLARSKGLLMDRHAPLDLSVVVAVYGEHQRMLSPHEHELGEGFLDRKLRQISWLTHGLPRSRSDLWIIDDGCPHGSGHLAREILARRHPYAPANVLFLDDAIKARHPVTRGMCSTDESRKGGSIQLGLYAATEERRPKQIVLFTDADLSTHLGQSGLLVDVLDRPSVDVAIGSRRNATSVVVKGGARSARGRLFIYLWKKLLPDIQYVHDTQCGFKAFRGSVVRELVKNSRVRDFAFDLELLLTAELRRPRCIEAVPIAWIDSEAGSTTTAVSPYLTMLRACVDLHRRHGSGGAEAEDFARAIEALNESTWNRAVQNLGPRLEDHHPFLDGVASWVHANELDSAAA